MAALTGVDKLASGESPLKAALSSGLTGAKEKVKEAVQGVTGSLGGKGGGNKKLKLTNIVEDIDVGVPLELAYRQWTEFGQFPKMMKKVEQADQESEEKLRWKAQVFWSHRTWESTVIEQVPCDHIVWRSKGQKGHVDGAVSFHELGPHLTRILVVLEYHPQGLFERTGNLWRAQGRRVRLELKHFKRHVMTHSLLHPDDVEGWMGEIRDGEVVDTGQADETEQTSSRKASSAAPRRRGEGRNGGGRRASGQRTNRRQTATKEKEGSRA
ncbi:MAG: SRPBCC family protein [Mycobacterium sp.]|uniref:SRPBCC family protein n=1 Tax=Mycobacterium sp. TaxID=1785 RepID=UPI00389A5034